VKRKRHCLGEATWNKQPRLKWCSSWKNNIDGKTLRNWRI